MPGLRAATYDGDTPPGGAALDPRPRAVRPHQPRPGAPLAAARAPAVGAVPAGAALRRRRRVPRLPRGLRVAPGGAAAAAARGSPRGTAPPPTFVLASATVADPGAPRRGTSSVCRSQPVTEDGSPRESMTFGLWEPGLIPGGGEHEAPHRRSAVAETADLLADLVVDGVQTVAFARSRAGVEVVASSARRSLAEVDPRAGARRWRPTGAATCPRTAALLESALRDGPAAWAGRDQRPRAGHRRQRPGRGAARRLAGHPAPRCGSRRAGPGGRARGRWR